MGEQENKAIVEQENVVVERENITSLDDLERKIDSENEVVEEPKEIPPMPTFEKFLEMAEEDPEYTCRLYESYVGIDGENRIDKLTGEVYVPTQEQLDLELKLIELRKTFRKEDYEEKHIEPYKYFLVAFILGAISGHRFFMGEFKESLIRAGLMLVLWFLIGKISPAAFWTIAVSEAVISWFFCKEDDNGKIKPLNIVDISNLLSLSD